MLNCHFFTILFLILLSQNSFALSSDKNQAIQLEADDADIDDKKGISIYNGKVVLIQGSTHLYADKLVVYHDSKHKVKKIEAFGSPAHFKQTPDNKSEDVKASSNKMIYFAKKELVHLYENATLWQGKNSFKGDKIIYNTKQDSVSASSKKSKDGSIIPTKRVRVTLSPNTPQ